VSEYPGTAWPQPKPKAKRADPAKPKPPGLAYRAEPMDGGRSVRRRGKMA